MTKLEANDVEAALSQLDTLFSTTEPVDFRSNPLMGAARRLYVQANQKDAEQKFDALMQAVQARQTELGETTGHRVDVHGATRWLSLPSHRWPGRIGAITI